MSAYASTSTTKYSERNFSEILFFDQSEEWSLLNFLKYIDLIYDLRDSSEPHRKYGIILNGIKNDENVSHKKREKAEQALLTYEDEKHSSEVREFWREKNLNNIQISIEEKATKSTGRIIDHINTIQDEASDILMLGKRDNIRRLKSGFGDNTEDLHGIHGGLGKIKKVQRSKIEDYFKRKRYQTPYTPPRRIFSHDASSDASIPTWIQQQSSSKGSNGQDTRIAPVNEQDHPPHTPPHQIFSCEASSDASIPFQIQQQSSNEVSNGQDTRIIPVNKQDQPPHTLSSYDASSSASVRKDRIPEDGIPEDGLLIESPYDIAIDCKLIVSSVCVRSKMEQWRCKSKYIEEIHKQDLMRYNILDTNSSSATEARNLFGRYWDDIVRTIEEFLTSSPDATSLASESVSTLASIDQNIEQDGRADDVKQYLKSISKNMDTAIKLRDIIRIECERLRENEHTIWKKRVLDLMEIFWKQFSNDRNRFREIQTEGHYIIMFVSHIFTMLFEDQLFLDCKWGESTLQCSADQLNQSLRDDVRRCTGNKIDAIISLLDFNNLEISTLEVSGSPSYIDHTHYVGDRNKTAKMLKIILNYIKINYPGDFGEFRRIKVYGVQIYNHEFYIYSMCMPFAGVYYFKLEKKFSYPIIPTLLFKELPKFASNLWMMRDMIISSSKSIRSYITSPISESSDDDSKIDKVKTSPRKKKRTVNMVD